MSSRTETDNKGRRVADEAPVLKQVLPLPEGFSLLSRSKLPAWLVDRELPIGRAVDPDRGIRLEEDSKASKQHAIVRRRDSGLEIVDLGSKNHTFVDGREVTAAPLEDGSVIRIGNTLFVLRMENARVEDAPQSASALHRRLLGQSQEVKALRLRLHRVAQSLDTVLLTGPSGAGKELAAAALHELSARSSRPFVQVNCASLPEAVVESAMFGHRRGSFTGADRDHDGYFKQADTGTLFLDEIGELPFEIQAKLLRVLQPAETGRPMPPGRNMMRIQTYGGRSELEVDVRVITATNVNLAQAIEERKFREDLFHRLAVLPVHFPALTARRDDIVPLFLHYLNLERSGQPARQVSAGLAELLLLHKWKGNVRELENLSKQLRVLLPGTNVFDLEHLSDEMWAAFRPDDVAPKDDATKPTRGAAAPSDSPDPDDAGGPQEPRITYDILTRLLDENEQNISVVARLLGRDRKTIRRRMDGFGIPRPNAQKPGNSKTKGAPPSEAKDRTEHEEDEPEGDTRSPGRRKS